MESKKKIKNKPKPQKTKRETKKKVIKNKIKNLSFREKVNFYLIDIETWPGKILDLIIIFFNLLICLIFVVETYSISESFKDVLWATEVVIIFFFIIEYAARLYGSKKRIKQFFSIHSIIDLIAIFPTLLLLFFPHLDLSKNIQILQLLRVLKVFRIFRFLRNLSDQNFFFGSISPHLLKVVRLISTILMIFFVTSGLFFYIETAFNPNVKNFGDAFYYSVVTLTTVGFGDITPVTTMGKWSTILMIISGIILIPWQASLVVKEWIKLSNKRNVVCKKCGLLYHDRDASHCKHCGNIIYQEVDGD